MFNSYQRQVVLFLVVGAFATAVNYLVFLFFLNILGIWYIVSSWIGYFSGVVLGYWLNSVYTFSAKDQISRRSLFVYIFVYTLSLCIGSVLLYILVEFLKLSPEAGNILVIFQTTTTNFLGCKYLVFKK